jgi:hypothetical protein
MAYNDRNAGSKGEAFAVMDNVVGVIGANASPLRRYGDDIIAVTSIVPPNHCKSDIDAQPSIAATAMLDCEHCPRGPQPEIGS